MVRRYMGDIGRSKPLGSVVIGSRQQAEYVIWATGEIGGGNCGHGFTKSEDSSTVRLRKHY